MKVAPGDDRRRAIAGKPPLRMVNAGSVAMVYARGFTRGGLRAGHAAGVKGWR